MCEVGRIALVPHMLLSSRRHFRKPELVGSRLSRACAVLSGGRGRRNGDAPGPDSRQAILNRRLEGPPRTGYTLLRKGRWRVGRGTRTRTCRSVGVVARPEDWVRT